MRKTYNTCPDCGASISRPKIRCSPCGYEKRLADNRRRAAAVAKRKSAELRARKAKTEAQWQPSPSAR